MNEFLESALLYARRGWSVIDNTHRCARAALADQAGKEAP